MAITFQSAKQWAIKVKRDVVALWIAARDPRTPAAAKIVAGAVAAYALSPIDLIPDFIPILGYVDDVLIVPMGILLAIRLVPVDFMTEFREAAAQRERRPVSQGGLLAIAVIWIAVVGLGGWYFWSTYCDCAQPRAVSCVSSRPDMSAPISPLI